MIVLIDMQTSFCRVGAYKKTQIQLVMDMLTHLDFQLPVKVGLKLKYEETLFISSVKQQIFKLPSALFEENQQQLL